VVERLDADSKKVWMLLKQKPGRFKVEIMAALGFGGRLERALRTLQSKRPIKVQGREALPTGPSNLNWKLRLFQL